MSDSPSGWLRSLAAEATPGGWEWKQRMWPRDALHALRSKTARYDQYPGVMRTVLDRHGPISDADARLIALAPDLAVLCADAIDALEQAVRFIDNAVENTGCDETELCGDEFGNEWVYVISAGSVLRALLARFAALQPDNTEEGTK